MTLNNFTFQHEPSPFTDSAWPVQEILVLGYPSGGTREERLQWLHRGKSRIGNHTTSKALLLSSETGALLALFNRLISASFV